MKGAKIQNDISWLFYNIFLFQTIKIKLNSRTPMTLVSPAVIFQALKPLQPHWPHWPLQPRWPLQPQKPYFTKELPDSGGWIILGTKMTNTVPLLWNNSSKIQIFTDILYSFCQRLLRPADVIFLKTKKIYQKFIISGFQNYFQTRFYLHISICQSQFIKHSSMWDTLYENAKEFTYKSVSLGIWVLK